MKVTTSETKDFTPFEVTIRIESLDELKVLWAHLNPSFERIKDIGCNIKEPFLKDVFNCNREMTAVWNVLNDKLIQLGVNNESHGKRITHFQAYHS